MQRIRHIEGIRFIAVLLVLVHHWVLVEPLQFLPFGSTISFVLSSFLIGRILFNLRPFLDVREFGRFFIRRILRIFPAYFFLIFFCYFFNYEHTRDVFEYLVTFVLNFVIVENGDSFGNLGHLWSVAVQEQYYLVIPFFLLLIPIRLIKPVCYFGFVLGVLYRLYVYNTGLSFWHLHVSTISCIDTFSVGTYIAYLSLYQSDKFEKITKNRYLFFVFLGILFAFALFGSITASKSQHVFFNLYRVFERSIVSIMCVWLIGYAYFDLFQNRISSFLNSPLVIFLGKISYGIYLYHFFVAKMVTSVLITLNLVQFDKIRYVLPFYFIITLIFAVMSWYIIENPFNKLKSRIFLTI